MTKTSWFLIVVSLVLVALFWGPHRKWRNHAKLVPRVVPAQERHVEQEYNPVAGYGWQGNRFQDGSGSFNGNSFQGGFCGSLGALGVQEAK